ncbi:MAG: hypothetical protein L0Y62_02985, partial [Nitrospirae bacterium]|nr:hypothetical protein [Nitrospirota bacterium]
MSLLPAYAAAFETKGLYPLSPYGVFSTFSAESLQRNEIGFGFNFERANDPDFSRLAFNFAYGVHDRFELNMTIPYMLKWEAIGAGYEDINIGLKHRLLDEDRHYPSVAYLLT